MADRLGVLLGLGESFAQGELLMFGLPKLDFQARAFGRCSLAEPPRRFDWFWSSHASILADLRSVVHFGATRTRETLWRTACQWRQMVRNAPREAPSWGALCGTGANPTLFRLNFPLFPKSLSLRKTLLPVDTDGL